MGDTAGQLDALVQENTALLEQFRAEGADLSARVALHLLCEMPDEDLAEAASSALQARVARMTLPADVVPDVSIATDEDGSYWELVMSVTLRPEAALISALEQAMTLETESLGGEPVSWEFAGTEDCEMEQMS